jgi:hypothetical protein
MQESVTVRYKSTATNTEITCRNTFRFCILSIGCNIHLSGTTSNGECFPEHYCEVDMCNGDLLFTLK